MYSYYNLFAGGTNNGASDSSGDLGGGRAARASRGRAARASRGRAARASRGRATRASRGRAASPSRGRATRASRGRAASPSRGRATRASRGRAARASRGRAARASRGRSITSKCGPSNYFKNGNMKKVGSKLLVWRGCREHTASGQSKGQLMKNKRGKLVSKAQHAAGVKNFKHLKKSGKMMTIRKGSNKPVKVRRGGGDFDDCKKNCDSYHKHGTEAYNDCVDDCR